MKYTDISKQKELLKKNTKSRGLARPFILFAVIITVGILFFFLKDRIKKEFSPISLLAVQKK
jgi:hypothetical protein